MAFIAGVRGVRGGDISAMVEVTHDVPWPQETVERMRTGCRNARGHSGAGLGTDHAPNHA